jgi:dTDP-glucose 4,6-dehydratase
MKVLVTGGAGFIGSDFIRFEINAHPDWDITNLDKLTYAGNLENLNDVVNAPQYHFVKGDIADWDVVDDLMSGGFDVVVNFAAESHVDRSIIDAFPFLETNIKGTQVLLEGAKKHKIGRFIQVSTDEVYGSTLSGKFTEDSPLSPTSPYAASKVCAEYLCSAYFKTHRTPVVITRCSNNYGPYQFPEKLIPLVITNAQENKPIPVYGDGLNVRDWIFVSDHCRALDIVIQKGRPGEKYNIGGGNEKTNLELIGEILSLLRKPKSLIQFVADRAAHDRRYAVDYGKIARELGWKPIHSFEDGLKETVDWYCSNQTWCSHVRDAEYTKYYERMYHNR